MRSGEKMKDEVFEKFGETVTNGYSHVSMADVVDRYGTDRG